MWGLQRLNLSQQLPVLGFKYADLVSRLQPQPELLRRSEKLRQPDRRVGRNPALPQHDIVHPRRGDMKFFGQPIHTHLHRLEKFLPQDLSRVDSPIRCVLPCDAHMDVNRYYYKSGVPSLRTRGDSEDKNFADGGQGGAGEGTLRLRSGHALPVDDLFYFDANSTHSTST